MNDGGKAIFAPETTSFEFYLRSSICSWAFIWIFSRSGSPALCLVAPSNSQPGLQILSENLGSYEDTGGNSKFEYFITSKSSCSIYSKGSRSSKLITGYASIFSMNEAIFVSYSSGKRRSGATTSLVKCKVYLIFSIASRAAGSSPLTLLKAAYFQSSATHFLHSFLLVTELSSKAFFNFKSLWPALLLKISLLATFKKISRSLFLIVNGLFLKTSHFGYEVIWLSVGTQTLSLLISVANLCVSFFLIYLFVLIMKLSRFTSIPLTNLSVTGASPMHSKNLIPFSLSKSSSLL